MIGDMRQIGTRRAWAGIVAAVCCVAGEASAALPNKPGAINDAPSPYVGYVIAAVLVGAVIAVSLKSSRRTHLD